MRKRLADAAELFNEEIHRFGGSVGGAGSVEVGEQLHPPAAQGPAQPGDLRDRAAGQDLDESAGPLAALLRGRGVVDRAQVLGDLPGKRYLAGRVPRGQRGVGLHPVGFGQLLGAAAQPSADLVERVAVVPAVSEGLLLHPATDLVQHVEAELDHVERVQHAHRRRQRVGQGGGVAPERVERGQPDAVAPLLLPTDDPAGVDPAGPDRPGTTSTSGWPWLGTPRITGCQPTPRWRATAATLSPSRPTSTKAQRVARAVRTDRGGICVLVFDQMRRGHSRGSVGQRHSRLDHTSTTGRPAAGRSDTDTGRRPGDTATTPQRGQPVIDVVVLTSSSTSPATSPGPAPRSRAVRAASCSFRRYRLLPPGVSSI